MNALIRFWLAACLAAATTAQSAEPIRAEPIRIGVIASLTGPSAESGEYTVNASRMAAEAINQAGGVLGRPIELIIEDNQSTNPGAVLAFSKLISKGSLTAILGPIRSTEMQAILPMIAKAGVPTMMGASETGLTHSGNRWLFRTRPNDSYSSRVMADFGVKTLGLRQWAIVHSTDSFGANGAKALIEAFKVHAIEPRLVQGYTNNSQDFTAAILAVKKSGAEAIATYMTLQTDVGIFSKQMRQLGLTLPLVGSPSIAGVSARSLAGDALHGTYAIVDFTVDANQAAQLFSKNYRNRFKVDPDFFASWAYDAIHIAATGIRASGSIEPEALRKSILNITGYVGAQGRYAFDENGDGLHGYNVVKNENDRITFIKRIEFR